MSRIVIGDLVEFVNDDLVGLLVAIPWERSALPTFESFVFESMIEQMQGENGVYLVTEKFGLVYQETPNRFNDLILVEDREDLAISLRKRAELG